jgi:hypothetical protein
LTARPASRSQSSGSAKRMPPRHPILKFHVAEQRSRPPVRPAHPASPTTTSTPANLAKAGPFFNSLLGHARSFVVVRPGRPPKCCDRPDLAGSRIMLIFMA